MGLTYSGAGVSIARADTLVSYIRKKVRSTFSSSVLGDIGAFGAFFDGRLKNYASPVLVSSVDGVGTKLMVAQLLGKHDTVGHDLVNHCVNDIAVCGARPLFFLDYIASGKLRKKSATALIDGFVRGCRENSCSLIGGETAEMPGLYDADEYDLAGMIVGVVDRKKIVSGKRIRKGDVLFGLPSTGLHTNGYSLARRVLFPKYRVNQYVPEIRGKVGDNLMRVHRSYLHLIQGLLKRFDVRGLAHITGGGIVGNTMRVMPEGLGIEIDWNSWKRPAIFTLVQTTGRVPEKDMRRTFNLGIGLVAVVRRSQAAPVEEYLRRTGERAYRIGEVIAL